MTTSTFTRRTLDTQAYLDLHARARDGTMVHLVLWLLVGALGRTASIATGLYVGVAGLFAVVLVARLAFERKLAARAAGDRRAHLAFACLLLASPLLWGLVAVLSFELPSLRDARPGLMLAMIGVAGSGGMALVIVPIVHRCYALCAIGPPTVMLLSQGERASTFLGVMAAMFIVYILRASRVVGDDYWNAVDARRGLEERARQLEMLNTTDALTQVRNRLHFDRQIEAEWSRAERNGSPLALLMIDLDNFKRVNDRYGHVFGDACLRATASALQSALFRPNDLLARYGGEEFMVLLPAIDAAGAQVVAERLCAAVAAIRISHDDAPVSISCSIGVHTTTHSRNGSIGHAIEQADQAMYLAKAQGRNRVVSTATQADACSIA